MIGGVSGNVPIPIPPDSSRGGSVAPDNSARPGPAADPADARGRTQRGESSPDLERPRRATPAGEGETVRLQPFDPSSLSRRSREALATFEQVASTGADDVEGGELVGVDVRV